MEAHDIEKRESVGYGCSTLFFDNMKLVYHIYYKKFKAGFSRYEEDLISAGRVGLWKACVNYSQEREIRFSSFACQCIRNEMCVFLKNELKHYGKTVGYDIILEDGQVHDITEITDNGQYEEMLGKIEFDLVMDRIKHRDEFKRIYDGELIADIAKSKKICRQTIYNRMAKSKNILDKNTEKSII